MRLKDLNRDQRLMLKQDLLTRKTESEGVSYGELADADSLITDEELEAEFGGTEFTPDDFPF